MVRTPVLAGFHGLRDSRSGRYLVDSFVPDYLKSQEVTGLYLQRRLISTFQVAGGFKGDFRQWEESIKKWVLKPPAGSRFQGVLSGSPDTCHERSLPGAH